MLPPNSNTVRIHEQPRVLSVAPSNRYKATKAMNKPMYLAGDLSGIQNYVLAVKSAGKAQAKRLRARSARVELIERAALWTLRERLGIPAQEFKSRILVIGGGGFQVVLPANADTARLSDINAELQRQLWDETNGELQLSMAWAQTYEEVRLELERRKRRAGVAMLQHGGRWNPDALSRPPLGEPIEAGGQACQVCGQKKGALQKDDEDERGVWHCKSCLSAQELGQKLTNPDWIWIRPGSRDTQADALGVPFAPTTERQPEAFHVARWIPQNSHGEPLTFEEIVNKSRGVRRLAVIKADVDDMGMKVGHIVRNDPSLAGLKVFNRDLDTFFGKTIYNYLKDNWRDIYTIYSGGDDLLMVGPWNTVLDFAGDLRKRFREGPGDKYGLTFSAGIALTPYRIPIRHAVERADELESEAKSHQGKNRCAALDTQWTWDNHDTVLCDGKKLAGWIENNHLPRSLIHRLLALVETEDPTGRSLRSARWTYQVSRNATQRQHREFRDWALVRTDRLAPDANREEDLKMMTASLKYAMLSTRNTS